MSLKALKQQFFKMLLDAPRIFVLYSLYYCKEKFQNILKYLV